MTQQKKWVRSKAGVDKELLLNHGWSILKTEHGYMLSKTQVTIHADEIRFNTNNEVNRWLSIYQDGVYIGSLWIDNTNDIERIEKFIKV